MIARVWRGVVRTGDADHYAGYIRETGFDAYGKTDGNRGAWLLRRDLDDGLTEFVAYSLWESREAIEGFAGQDIETAVYYPEDDEYLVERDEVVAHFEVVASG